MEELIESVLVTAIAALIPVLISYILSNFMEILLATAVFIFLLILGVLVVKRKITTQWLKRAENQHREAASQLNAIIVSDTFKDVEMGLAMGETYQRLKGVEQTVFSLHEKSEQLRKQLQAQKAAFFSLAAPLMQAKNLQQETNELSHRVDQVLFDLSRMNKDEKEARELLRQAEEKLAATSGMIHSLSQKTGFPLDELKEHLRQAETLFHQVNQSAAFDAIQSKQGVTQIYRTLDSLRHRTLELEKNVAIFHEMRDRLIKHEKHLLQLAGHESLRNTKVDFIPVLRQIDPMLQKLDDSLRLGKEVNLRAAAEDMETMVRDATDLVERARKPTK
ncbi:MULTISPECIES: hypothetical protein [unclassified Paenibacillus]|uniref:hypothetical protein n=1 Tax=unclassified Paenibacillus TaxID=185978 RepID=UPI001AEAB571|nr:MULTISPECIES: hypothetical protein [unclassified Paenibacillus]MBP1156415.1 DNA-binding transcriptional MerR regulator [Paenibacillus sp. PvP091]MBP1168199.1 DNA-binding transcriptional MerR regulator [Paenibacillus sp. PvR098]MBP2439227.1 DNA-binding transcriptional MerR regulator [Paenibacillus sp. PvP052]